MLIDSMITSTPSPSSSEDSGPKCADGRAEALASSVDSVSARSTAGSGAAAASDAVCTADGVADRAVAGVVERLASEGTAGDSWTAAIGDGTTVART